MKEVELKRAVSLPLLICYGLGTILGAGIYVLIGKVTSEAGLYSPLSFLLAAALAAFSAYSYGQLSKRFPQSAGEVIFVDEGFGLPWLSTLVGFMVLATGTVSAATICEGFIGYLQVFVDIPDTLALILVVGLITLFAALGVVQSVGSAALLTFIEVIGLCLIIYVSRHSIGETFAAGEALALPETKSTWLGVFSGAFLAFYAYIGFEDMVNMAEEVKNVKKNMPLAIGLAVALSTVMYLLVAWAALGTLSLGELAESEAPLTDVFVAQTGSSPEIITGISLIAVINGGLVQVIMASRVIYGMAREGKFSKAFTKLNSTTHTPVKATLLVGGLVLAFSLFFPLETLARIASGLMLGVFFLVNGSLTKIYYQEKNRKVVIPAIGAILCLLLLGLF